MSPPSFPAHPPSSRPNPSEASEALVRAAQSGCQASLEALLGRVQHDVYRLALRMLWHPADAEDATQEILVRIIRGLGSFRGESGLETWVFRVACNHLLTRRRGRAERMEIGFDLFAAQVEAGLSTAEPESDESAEDIVFAREIRLACTNGMLLCLDRDQRVAFVLGDIFGLESPEAASVLEVEPATYRKRLSRARRRLRAFMHEHCGLVNEEAPCRCARQVGPALVQGRLKADRLRFSSHPVTPAVAERKLDSLARVHRAVVAFRSHPDYAAPDSIMKAMREILASEEFVAAVS